MEGKQPSRLLSVPFLVIASVIVQVAFLAMLPDAVSRNQSVDWFTHHKPVTENLLRGKGLVDNAGNLCTRYPPGYFFFLAPLFWLARRLSGEPLVLVAVANVILASATGVLLFRLGEKLFDRRVGGFACLLWTTYPLNLWLLKQPDDEVPFLFVMVLGLLVIASTLLGTGTSGFFLGGALLGLAALVRPAAWMLGPFLALGLLILKIPNRLKAAALLTAGFFLPILPWEIVMYRSLGQILPLSSGGPPTMMDGLTFAVKPRLGDAQVRVPADLRDWMERTQAKRPELDSPGKILRYLTGEGAEAKPLLELLFFKIVRSWYGTEMLWHETEILLVNSVYLVLALPGVFLAGRWDLARKTPRILLLTLVVYFWGMTTMVFSLARYMVPAIMILQLFAAVTLDQLVARWRREPDVARA
ncbi:MAG TPA: glycosyltransferase family 39 protein [Candidatus Polarisedimenticolia bacterium]|jgi:hypothetical protein|nr:glycosyltransferase family 39 protein [Candidatus Polarisedimenticolia bacterium]